MQTFWTTKQITWKICQMKYSDGLTVSVCLGVCMCVWRSNSFCYSVKNLETVLSCTFNFTLLIAPVGVSAMKRVCACMIQHRIPVPMAMNVPNVPPPWIITFPTLLISSRPRKPYLFEWREKLKTLKMKNEKRKKKKQMRFAFFTVMHQIHQTRHRSPYRHKNRSWNQSSFFENKLAADL